MHVFNRSSLVTHFAFPVPAKKALSVCGCAHKFAQEGQDGPKSLT